VAFLFRPFPLGRILGIPIRVMPAVVVLLVLVLAWAGSAAGAGGAGWLLVTLLLLGVVLIAHELGHALVARRLGLRVLDITIWPLGGMARLEGLGHRPEVEGLVALAGPAVNLLLAGVASLLPGGLAWQFTLLNLVLGLGNLVPAFPLDGGRVLRAWLARRSPAADATRAAVQVANGLALGMVVAGLLSGSLFLGLLMAFYVWSTAKGELVQVILRTGRMPVLGTRQVFLRALRPAPAPGSGEVLDPDQEDPGLDPGELERFHGSLEEYLRRRRHL